MTKYNFSGRGKGKRAQERRDLRAVAVCSRCGKALKDDMGRADTWNIDARDGVVVGFVGPDCQTAEEFTMAEAEAATSVYVADDDGRVYQFPKLMAVEE